MAPVNVEPAQVVTTTSSVFGAYATSYARFSVLNALRDGIRHGVLELTDDYGLHTFGHHYEGQKLPAIIKVNSEDFYIRIVLHHDVGFSEAFMCGDFSTPDLKAVLNLWINNRHELAGLSTLYNRLSTVISGLALRLFGQSFENSRISAATGYDCSNAFFKAILSRDMMYSCAIWSDAEGGVRGDLERGFQEGELETAQQRKLRHILSKARVKAGHRLLEFGTGWGSMSIEAAKLGATVDSLTLSEEQKKLAEERIKAAGFEDRITVHLMDYRSMPKEFEKQFDAFVATEMFEAVGLKYWPQFWRIMDWALKDKAAIVITATSQPEDRYDLFQSPDYARKYQWPNTFLPSATHLPQACQEAVPGKFVLESIEDHGIHYPRTLREWNYRLQRNWGPELKQALIRDQPQLAVGDRLEIFKRKWEYMFDYAAVGYASAYTSMHCWTFARPCYVSVKCD